jgi:hypothetical protein
LKLQQLSGIQPVTMPNPPTVTKTCMWLLCEGDVGCARCCAMSAALVPRSCNQGCGRCAHQLSERANASSPCLNINHKPLETNKNVVVAALSSRAVGGNGDVVLGHGKPHISRCGSHSKHVLHASTQAEHRSPPQNSAMSCLWCVY